MQEGYFKNKNILITGITGFIGSNLAEKLHTLGANVYGISRSSQNKYILTGDISDFLSIDKIIKSNQIDICFHLAATSLVESGQSDPHNTFRLNILGTLNILESARKNNLEKIIVASTAQVYGNNPPFKETDQIISSRPYETSKICTDLLAQSYANTFNLPVLISRCVNTYGPNDLNLSRLVPKTINSILHDQNPKMWGEGNIIRNYLYINDVINAYICLAKVNMETITKDRIFNFGSNNFISVKDLMQKIINLSKKNMKIEKINGYRNNEVREQNVSWLKAKKILGWKPKTSLDTGLKKTMEWYEEYFKKNYK
ncbi:MAG: NAD(P)-dependent oxidoreductase [Patescibacteria group bacterium]